MKRRDVLKLLIISPFVPGVLMAKEDYAKYLRTEEEVKELRQWYNCISLDDQIRRSLRILVDSELKRAKQSVMEVMDIGGVIYFSLRGEVQSIWFYESISIDILHIYQQCDNGWGRKVKFIYDPKNNFSESDLT